jgi:hypothetical protein
MVRPRVVTAELRHEAAWGLARGRQKLALGLAVCLPIPVLAMSGLAVPLPSAVYRVAVAIVQSTEGLARAFTGTEEETRVLSTRRGSVAISPQRQRSGASPRVVARVAPPRSSARVQPAAPIRTRSFGAAPRKRSRAPQRSHSTLRTPSVPASEPRTDAATPAAVAPAPAPPQAPTPQVTKERLSTEPTPRPADVAPIELGPSKPPVNPPPAPPPAPTPEPSLLDPVTKPLEPVTKSLDPVTKPLAPVTDTLQPITTPLEPVIGRLGVLSP